MKKEYSLTMNLEPKPFDLNTIQKEIPFIARCLKADPLDDHAGIPEDKRWNVGDELRVVRIEMSPLGTFLYGEEGQSMDIKRAGLIMFTHDDLSEEQWEKHGQIMSWIGAHYPNCKDLPLEEQDRISKEAWKAVMGTDIP